MTGPRISLSLTKNQVLINNKTSRFLNGHFIFFGILFLVPGIYGLIELQWIIFAPNLFISWFLFATHSGTEIDTEKRKFREYNRWFGIFKTGKWQTFDIYLGVTLVSLNKVYRIYSQSNRGNSSTQKEFWIYFVDKAKKPAIPLKKCKNHEQAQTSMDELAIWLKMPVYSVTK